MSIDWPLAKFMVFICFGIWLTGTIATLFLVPYRAYKYQEGFDRKYNLHHPVDLITTTAISAWVAMWCFRTMY